VATKYYARKPINHKGTFYRPGDEITGFTGWWRYWQYLRYARVNQVDTATAPAITLVTAGDKTLTLTVTTAPTAEDPFTNFEYQLDGGSWVAFDPADVESPFVITGLTNGTTYSVCVRADNKAGAGLTSVPALGTPRTVPAKPTALLATPGDQQLSIAFTEGDDGGAGITNYKYRIGTGSWVAFAPADFATPVVITGLTNDVEVSVTLRAVNPAGDGAISDPVVSTPTA
jgi:hypothetical protein